MTDPHPTVPHSTDDLARSMAQMAEATGPTFFALRTPLPAQGRLDTLLAASGTMSVVLKTYAQAGENGLHSHPNEDHVFVVLQGHAEFYGPDGETREVGLHQGVFLPSTAKYWFKAGGTEPLVMLRVGAATGAGPDVLHRTDGEGKPMDGFSDANKQVDLVLLPGQFFG